MNPKFRNAAMILALAVVLPALANAGGTIPQGTTIHVVIDQAISSKDGKIGQRVTGTVSKSVTVGGKVLIPKGSTVKLSVSSVQASGRLSTPAKLYLKLRTVTVGGKTYLLATSSAGHTEGSKAKRDTGFIGGGAAGGAIIGRRGSGHGRRSSNRQEGCRVSRGDAAGFHDPDRRSYRLIPNYCG